MAFLDETGVASLWDKMKTYITNNSSGGITGDPVGTIKAYSGTPPVGWLKCDGRKIYKPYCETHRLSTSTYYSADTWSTITRYAIGEECWEELYPVIGNTYGGGSDVYTSYSNNVKTYRSYIKLPSKSGYMIKATTTYELGNTILLPYDFKMWGSLSSTTIADAINSTSGASIISCSGGSVQINVSYTNLSFSDSWTSKNLGYIPPIFNKRYYPVFQINQPAMCDNQSGSGGIRLYIDPTSGLVQLQRRGGSNTTSTNPVYSNVSYPARLTNFDWVS